MKAPRAPKVYATLRREYVLEELQRLGFRWINGELVKRGAGRRVLAKACARGSAGFYSVTPLVRHWK